MMYIPKYFQLDDEEMIYDFIDKYSFSTLFSQHNGEPYATHLPLILNKSESALYGHFARPHCYISPSWLSGLVTALLS